MNIYLSLSLSLYSCKRKTVFLLITIVAALKRFGRVGLVEPTWLSDVWQILFWGGRDKGGKKGGEREAKGAKKEQIASKCIFPSRLHPGSVQSVADPSQQFLIY